MSARHIAKNIEPESIAVDQRQLPALSPDRAEIEAVAYRFWLERGCPIGSPEVDWLRAENELASGRVQNPTSLQDLVR